MPHSPPSSSTFKKNPPSIFTPLTPLIQSMDQTSPATTPPMTSQAPVEPTPLVIPKAFKYPEMYIISPTDSIMSPVSKGLLARTRSKISSSRTLIRRNSSSATTEQHKVQDSKAGDMVAAFEI